METTNSVCQRQILCSVLICKAGRQEGAWQRGGRGARDETPRFQCGASVQSELPPLPPPQQCLPPSRCVCTQEVAAFLFTLCGACHARRCAPESFPSVSGVCAWQLRGGCPCCCVSRRVFPVVTLRRRAFECMQYADIPPRCRHFSSSFCDDAVIWWRFDGTSEWQAAKHGGLQILT